MNDISFVSDICYRNTPERDLRLDLRIPSLALPPPLILYIPMGGMRSCPKESAPHWITDYGFALASIECRVSSEAIAPAAVLDCKAAVRWLRAHADYYGFNGSAIGAWGHSAGGMLAALLATSGDAPELSDDYDDHPTVSCQVQAACDECGAPHNLAYFASPQVQTEFAPVTENLRRYLGAPVEGCSELARLVSPSSYVSPRCPPMLLLHGDEDDIVPLEETRMFYQSLRECQVDATLRILPGAGHSWHADLTRDEVVAFFRRVLAGLPHSSALA